MFSMRRSSRKMLIVGALTLAALTGPVAVASAADTLTLTKGAGPAPGSTVAVKATGTVSGDSVLLAYAERFGTTCGPTASDHRFDPDRELVLIGADPANPDPSASLTAGDYNVVLRWAPLPPGGYRLCVYLYGALQDPSTAPLAAAGVQMVLIDDADADGVPDDVDACPDTAGSQADGCPPPAQQPATPVTPVTPVVPGGIPTPPANVPAAPADPTGVLKLKSSKGKATACGASCLVRTRTVGPFSFSLKVKVKGATTKETASVTLRTKTAQAGQAGKVCVSSYSTKLKLTCKKITWAVGKKVTLTGSIATPAKIGAGSRPGFAVTAYVGKILVGSGASLYLKSAGGHVVPDTNESACAASAGAHAAC